MQQQLLSSHGNIRQTMFRILAVTVLFTSLMIGVAWPMSASGQIASPIMPPAAGMGATSPLAMRSTRPAGIPLGATEIGTSGVSPVAPFANMGTAACGGPSSDSSSTPLFDGGGLSRNANVSCADSQVLSSPLPPSSSAGPVGIPLGATELGSAGLSAATPVPSPDLPANNNPAGMP
jgi:hypothetical protein